MQVTYDSAFVIERFFNISTLPLQKIIELIFNETYRVFFRRMFIQVYRGKVLFYKFLLMQSTVHLLCTRLFTYFILI